MIRAADAAAIQPLYFGPPEGRLFGCYHAALAAPLAIRGVVLCGPMGHEYMACHRAVRQLAVRLSQMGHSALRFDYYGSGDSAGAATDASTSRWLRDIGEAMKELKRLQAHADVSVMGLRLGATLALLHGHEMGAAELPALVLWNPIVNGRAYVAELMALQRERYGHADTEVLGFPLPIPLRKALENINLQSIGSARARRVLIVDTGSDGSDARALESRLRETGSVVEYRPFDAPAVWKDPHKTAVPNEVVRFIASWMTGARNV